MYKKMLEIIRNNPGLSGVELKGKGFSPMNHGSLRKAELLGLIEYRDGWFVIEKQSPQEEGK